MPRLRWVRKPKPRRFPLKNLPSPLPSILGGLKIKVPRIGDLAASEWVIILPETALLA